MVKYLKSYSLYYIDHCRPAQIMVNHYASTINLIQASFGFDLLTTSRLWTGPKLLQGWRDLGLTKDNKIQSISARDMQDIVSSK